MNEEHIRKVKRLLTSWNPLGERSNQISDLNEYETEAVDILFHIIRQQGQLPESNSSLLINFGNFGVIANANIFYNNGTLPADTQTLPGPSDSGRSF